MENYKGLNFPPKPVSPCPANSFNLDLNQPINAVRVNALWEEWEQNYPDDPTGEKYLAEYTERYNTPPVEEKKTWVKDEEIELPEIPQIKPDKPAYRPRGRAPVKIRTNPNELVPIRLLLPVGLRDNFNAVCRANSLSMSNAMRELIRVYVENNR